MFRFLILSLRTDNSEPSTSLSGGEGGHSKSRPLKPARASTEGASPLVGSPRGGHIPRDPSVRIPPSRPSFSPTLLPLALHASRFTSSVGGEGGIRTHGPIAGTHAFQACRFDHSRTSPRRFSRGGILTCGPMTSKLTASARHQRL